MEKKLVVKKELAEKNLFETQEGGIGQDDPENKQKSRGSIRGCSHNFGLIQPG